MDLTTITSEQWQWGGFFAFVFVMLALDLGVFHRKNHEIRFREAMLWTLFWVSLAMGFNLLMWHLRGKDAALNFFAGYLLEMSLSVDNLFVFLLVFHYFKVPSDLQHKTLFWGIIGVLLMRGLFIGVGLVLITMFHWVIYIFGAFLIYTGFKLAFQSDEDIHPEHNPLIRFCRKLFPVTKDYHGNKFFTRENGILHATPLFIVLVVIETTDVLFAVDSVPAVLAITLDPYVVFTSNVFAILGLRSLYFALAGFMKLFHHLHYGLSAILVFVGVKMVLADFYKIPIELALGFIALVLAGSVVASLLFPKPDDEEK